MCYWADSWRLFKGKVWLIPEDAKKPVRNKKEETLLEILQDEKSRKYSGGIYHKTQIDLTYNSNHIEGSRLSHDQTRYIFETNTINMEGEIVNVDDVVETTNIFHITILKKKWMYPQNWGNSPGQLKQAFEFKMKPAPLKTIALCERLNHEEGKFYKTVTTKDLFT